MGLPLPLAFEQGRPAHQLLSRAALPLAPLCPPPSLTALKAGGGKKEQAVGGRRSGEGVLGGGAGREEVEWGWGPGGRASVGHPLEKRKISTYVSSGVQYSAASHMTL